MMHPKVLLCCHLHHPMNCLKYVPEVSENVSVNVSEVTTEVPEKHEINIT